MESSDGFNNNFNLLLEFAEINKRLPKKDETYKNIKLYTFCQQQRKNYKNNKLTEEQINKLNSIPNWYWTKNNNSWEDNYNLLLEYYNTYNKLPKYKEELGKWYNIQKSKFKNNKLTVEQINKLKFINSDFRIIAKEENRDLQLKLKKITEEKSKLHIENKDLKNVLDILGKLNEDDINKIQDYLNLRESGACEDFRDFCFYYDMIYEDEEEEDDDEYEIEEI